MKTRNLIIAIVLILNIAGIQAQTSMFDKLSNNKSITTVYISKALLGMMPAGTDMGGMNIKNMSEKLEQVEIYTTENKEAMKLMKTEATSLLQNKTYEVLMAIKEDSENVTFYAHKENDKFKDLVMFVDQPDECVLIRLVGTFTAEDIQQITNNK